jgi:hypothetical protein
MAREKDIIKLEKDIIAKKLAIRSRKETPASSGIGKLINLMKKLDEPLYDKLMKEYKELLEEIKK